MEIQFLGNEGLDLNLDRFHFWDQIIHIDSVYAAGCFHIWLSEYVYSIFIFLFQGVPLRIEIGPRDVSSGSVVISRRDIPGKQGKVFGISMEPSILEAYVKDKLDEIQSSLLERAIAFRDRFVPFLMLFPCDRHLDLPLIWLLVQDLIFLLILVVNITSEWYILVF